MLPLARWLRAGSSLVLGSEVSRSGVVDRDDRLLGRSVAGWAALGVAGIACFAFASS